MAKQNNNTISNEDWALYIAKRCDLNADTMNEILHDLNNGRADEVYEAYGKRFDDRKKQKFLNDVLQLEPEFEYYEVASKADPPKFETRYYLSMKEAQTAIVNELKRNKNRNPYAYYCDVHKVSFYINPDGSLRIERTEGVR